MSGSQGDPRRRGKKKRLYGAARASREKKIRAEYKGRMEALKLMALSSDDRIRKYLDLRREMEAELNE